MFIHPLEVVRRSNAHNDHHRSEYHERTEDPQDDAP